MSPLLYLGVFGSIASIVSLIISWKLERPKWVHSMYAFVLTMVTGLFVLNFLSISETNETLSKELETRNSVEHNAARILSTYSNINDVGENRGFILSSFAFLEKYKTEFPETYEIAKELVIEGLKITKNSYGEGAVEEYSERKRLEDGASAMHDLLEGMMKSNG